MNDGRDGYGGNGRRRDRDASIDELLDQAVAAINRGDRESATALVGQVLAVDRSNEEAEHLLADDVLGAGGSAGEIRRLTILFADLVDSTALSTRVDPETYRLVVGRYREQVLQIVERFEGYVASTKGDGLLAVFGHPTAHEDDARRAVSAGMEITREVTRLSDATQRRFSFEIQVRVGVHRGLVYLDTAQDDVYGLAANLAARVSGLAPPGSVVVSDAVAPLIRKSFELEPRPPAPVSGVEAPVAHQQVIGERSAPTRATRGPLVGRDRELARLQKSWGRAQAGTLTTPGVVFRGEAGIGKSRLAAAITDLVDTSAGVVLELLGSTFHTDVGLYPIRNLIERRCAIERSTEPADRLVLLRNEIRAQGLDEQASVPALAPVLGLAREHGYEPVAAEGRKLQEFIANGVHEYLRACLGEGAALVIAEDLHWFDQSTLDVLGALLGANLETLLVVATGRPGRWLPDDWPVKVFDLAPLSDEQTTELIGALEPTASAEQTAAVCERCDGIPFYIEQLVAGLAETGVPEPLYEPLFARLRTSANVVPLVEAAGVIGRYIDRRLLRAVVDMSDDDIDDVSDQLEDALVLEAWGTDGWRFRHELLREVAAELAPPSVARDLHARVADALVRGVGGGEPDWPLVASHYQHAQRFAEAVAAFEHACAGARRRGALTEALSYLTHAIAELDRTTPGAERDQREMRLRLERGFLVAAADGPQSREAGIDFERCLQLGGTELTDDVIAIMTGLAAYYLGRADMRRSARILEILQAGLEGRPSFLPLIQGSRGLQAWLRGEFEDARPDLEKASTGWATDMGEIAAVWSVAADPIAAVLMHLGWNRLMQGDLAGAEAALEQAVRRAEELGFPEGPYTKAWGRFVESCVWVEAGQLDRTDALLGDLMECAEQYGFDLTRLMGATQQATIAALRLLDADGDTTALSEQAEAVMALVDVWRSTEMNMYITFADGILGRLLTAAGNPDLARVRLDSGLDFARESGMHFYDAELLRLRAHTHADPVAMQSDLQAALALARRQGAHVFELRAALDDFERRGEIARSAVAAAVGRMPTESAMPEMARARSVMELTIPE
jgi:class 3 adenylate cyclase/tetratricopeptide (TPR) repeat protein